MDCFCIICNFKNRNANLYTYISGNGDGKEPTEDTYKCRSHVLEVGYIIKCSQEKSGKFDF